MTLKKFRTYIYLKHYYYDTVYAEDEEEAIKRINEQYRDDTYKGAQLEIIAVRLAENKEK